LCGYSKVSTGCYAGNRSAKTCAKMTIEAGDSVQDFEAKFLNNGIGQHLFGNALDFPLGLIAGQTFERQNEKFALADFLNAGVPQRRERSLNGLALRVENRGLQHYPDVCFHLRNYISPAVFAAARKSTSNFRLSSGDKNAA
jgi:hypothetical protein